jgi:anti-sigma regulatory factor (Ser/Thr protein kinase)
MSVGRITTKGLQATMGEGMRELTTAPPLVWSRTFPADAAQIGEARRFLAGILGGLPEADDAVLCLSELATNATVHSRSRDGGQYAVRVELHDQYLRVAVRDQGGHWAQPNDADDRHGRGLLIVSRMASAWGRDGDAAAGWTVWFEIDCSQPNGGSA